MELKSIKTSFLVLPKNNRLSTFSNFFTFPRVSYFFICFTCTFLHMFHIPSHVSHFSTLPVFLCFTFLRMVHCYISSHVSYFSHVCSIDSANKLATCFALIDIVLCSDGDPGTRTTACGLCSNVINEQLRDTRCRYVWRQDFSLRRAKIKSRRKLVFLVPLVKLILYLSKVLFTLLKDG